jgi:hypothetical protein
MSCFTCACSWRLSQADGSIELAVARTRLSHIPAMALNSQTSQHRVCKRRSIPTQNISLGSPGIHKHASGHETALSAVFNGAHLEANAVANFKTHCVTKHTPRLNQDIHGVERTLRTPLPRSKCPVHQYVLSQSSFKDKVFPSDTSKF